MRQIIAFGGIDQRARFKFLVGFGEIANPGCASGFITASWRLPIGGLGNERAQGRLDVDGLGRKQIPLPGPPDVVRYKGNAGAF
jgi:hypothetical protein